MGFLSGFLRLEVLLMGGYDGVVRLLPATGCDADQPGIRAWLFYFRLATVDLIRPLSFSADPFWREFSASGRNQTRPGTRYFNGAIFRPVGIQHVQQPGICGGENHANEGEEPGAKRLATRIQQTPEIPMLRGT